MSGTVDVVALPDEPGLAEALAYGDSYLAFRQRFDRIPGVQAAVLAEGDIRLSSAHGLADVATETPLTDKHLFRVASQSKTVTATLIFQLVEDGVLRLDDTAGQLIPELTASPVADRSIRELLSRSTIDRDRDNPPIGGCPCPCRWKHEMQTTRTNPGWTDQRNT